MSRLALLNMFIGFVVLSLVAAAGSFLATEITEGYLHDPGALESWRLLISKSAHGHTNLFSIIHILFGLTLPYSGLSTRSKLAQTVGLGLGTLAMGPVMLLRAYIGPTSKLDSVEVCLGIMLSAALLALATHAAGLALRLMRRSQ
jgi:hypothetical protein